MIVASVDQIHYKYATDANFVLTNKHPKNLIAQPGRRAKVSYH